MSSEGEEQRTADSGDERDSDEKREENVRKAYQAVLDGMSRYKAAKEFNVPLTTLARRVKSGHEIAKKGGRKPWLSEEDENDLKNWVLDMKKIACPLNRNTLRAVVKNILDRKKLVLFPPHNLPSSKWVDRFLGRHENLTYRVPESLSHLRAGIRYSDILQFFDGLNTFLQQEHNLDASDFLKIENGDRIYNCDETGFFLNADDKSSRVLVEKGTKNVYKRGGEGKQMMTVLFCISASGDNIRPLILNKGKNITDYTSIDKETDQLYCVANSERGWMVGEVFFSWIANIFNPELEKKKIQKPVILFLDGHSSHLTLETVKFAKENEIIMYSLLPHASHILQPLDVSVFKPLKAQYREVLNQVRGTLAKQDLAKRNFPYVLMKAVALANIKPNAVSGFRATGLCPYNPYAIKKDKLLGGEEPQGTEGEEVVAGQEIVDVADPSKERDTQIYKAGFLDGLQNAYSRFEAVLPNVLLTLYRSMTSEESQSYMDYNYLAWQELQKRPEPSAELLETRLAMYYQGDDADDLPSLEVQEEAENREEPGPSSSTTGASATASPPLVPLSPALGPTPPQISSQSSSMSASVTPMGVKERTSESARRRLLTSPVQHFKTSPFKAYLEIPKSLLSTTKGKPQRETVPRALTSEDNIRYQEEKKLKKMKAEEEKEKRKAEREAKKAEKAAIKNTVPPKKRRKTKTPTPSSSDPDEPETDESDDDNRCGVCQRKSGALRLWIGCETCQKWFHKLCVNVSLDLTDEEIESLSFVHDCI